MTFRVGQQLLIRLPSGDDPHILRHKLVRPKDPQPSTKKCELIYGIKGSDCDASYVGETKQALGSRLKQHRRASTNESQLSAVFSHITETGHKFDDCNIVILDCEQCWYERGVREAIYECIEQLSMNKWGGLSFSLSRTWDRALKQVQCHLSGGRPQGHHQMAVRCGVVDRLETSPHSR